jgi:CheY-like chemotaxis protein
VVFREFQRLDEGAKVARGLGLGLSIVERIAKVLDHRVDLRSTLKRGSRFSVEVPISTAALTQAQREAAPVDRGQLLGITVLCIDNEPKVLDGMETLLGGWGCRVLKAPDLATAIAAITQVQDAPQGLLVDYHLDRGTGLDAIAELRRRFGADLPAILITADRSPHVRDEAGARNVQVLSKPLKPAALRALMAQWRVQRVAAAE